MTSTDAPPAPLAAARTWLYVPASRPDAMARAHARGADALVFDLEDGVAPVAKESARAALRACLRDGYPGAAHVVVRVNPAPAEQRRDLEALAGCPLDAVLVPKLERAADLDASRRAVAHATPRHGDGVALVALVETLAGLLGVGAILQDAADLAAIALGGEDLAADLGVSRTDAGVELQFPRAWLAAWATLHGRPALDTPFLGLDDADGLGADTLTARQLGFSGKFVIHPSQVPIVRAALAPGDAELRHARRVVAAVARAREPGVLVVDGRMVDAPVVRQAEAVLRRARPGEARESEEAR